MTTTLVATSRGARAVVISVVGEVDMATRDQLVQASDHAVRLDSGVALLVLDLHEVTFIDAAGLGTVIACLLSALGMGLRIAVVVEHPNVVRMFVMNGIQQAFPVATSLEGALSM